MRLRPFRAVTSLKEAAQGLADIPRVGKKDLVAFDDGFREGYQAGRRQGASDGRDAAAENAIAPPCLGLPDEYCEGFHRAFFIGYADGYGNQAPTKPKQAVQVAAGQ